MHYFDFASINAFLAPRAAGGTMIRRKKKKTPVLPRIEDLTTNIIDLFNFGLFPFMCARLPNFKCAIAAADR